jgi:integrase/recombinase XerC
MKLPWRSWSLPRWWCRSWRPQRRWGLSGIRAADINLTAHTVRVLHGKGDKATTRGFHPSATDALARWIDTRRGLGIRSGPLFCTLAGGPLHPQYVRNLLHRLGTRADLSKRVHPHGLRHILSA